MWIKNEDGNYINPDTMASIWAVAVAPIWKVRAGAWNEDGWFLNGTWSTEAAAQEAIRELIDGVDPATYGD